MLAPALVIALAAAVAALPAQTPATPSAAPSLAGGWTLNKDLSDQPQGRSDGEGRDSGQNERRGGGSGGGRRRGGGGFGGGGFGNGGGAEGRTPEDAQRMRNALRDEMQPPARLIISSDVMINEN